MNEGGTPLVLEFHARRFLPDLPRGYSLMGSQSLLQHQQMDGKNEGRMLLKIGSGKKEVPCGQK